ncbi:MAG: tetratricopeptide repeat protein [Deltaproteobacteria bacterium]|nr:tetratricopeptide repeat protein [Deltaproteobacteria bacterium]
MVQAELGGNVALDNVEHARQALAKSDLAGALFHVSSALATEPQNAQWRAILDEAIKKAPDAMVFVRKDEAKADYITAATRGYVHAWKGEWLDAFGTVADVCAVRPDAPFMLWATEWAARPEAIAAISAEDLEKRIIPPMLRMVSSCPSPVKPEDERRKNIDAISQVLGAFYARHQQHGFLIFAIASTLRRQGQFDSAIQFASFAFQIKNDWNTAIGVACAYRDAKKVDEAVQWFRHAHSLRPDDVAALLDVGDTYLDADRYDEAVGAYREVLAKDPKDDWAETSILYATYKKSGNEADFQPLFDAMTRSQRAKELYFRVVGDHPYFTWLPNPGDSTYFAARQVVGDLTRKPPASPTLGIDIHLQHMEAPSALRAFKLWTDARGWNGVGMRAKVEGVQEPDTRFAKGQVDFTLWAFDDKVPRPNCPNPDPRVASAIAAIAVKPYSLAVWDKDAKALAAQMGAPWLNQLLFTMVNPPPLPQLNYDPFFWVQKVQVAVALVIANLDQGWEGSARKRALESIARGPVDWTVDAAVIAMGWIAKNDASVRPAVEQFYGWLETQIPKTGFTCYEYALVNVWRNLGGHSPEHQQKLDLWKKRCESQKIEFAEEKHAGLTLEDYAKMSAERDQIMLRAASGPGGGMGMTAQAAGGALLGGLAKGFLGGMAGNIAGQAVQGAGNSMGYMGELAQLCVKYKVPQLQGGMLGRVPQWDQRINQDQALQKRFFAAQQKASLAAQGLSDQEQRAMQQVMSGAGDVESMKQNHAVAVQQIESGQGGDPDPVVFPNGKIAKLSDYVGLLKAMQGGDFNGALRKYGLDMGSYTGVAQGWGAKLASDPVLNAKFGKMMSG